MLPKNSPLLPRRLLSVESSFVALSVSSKENEGNVLMKKKTTSPTISVLVIVIHFSPLLIELFHGDELQLSLNERSLLHFDSQDVSSSSSTTTSSTTGSDKEASRKLRNDIDGDVEAEEDIDRHHGKVVVDYGEDGEMNSCYSI